MRKPIQISIPAPCHENWEKMTPADKGKFCASCQKNVIDFTRSSDREIAAAVTKENNLCGRFTETQLNRKLIVPKEKSTAWITAGATIVSIIASTTQSSAQTALPIEQTQQSTIYLGEPAIARHEIKGTVSDESGLLPGATIKITGSGIETQTNVDGEFSIFAKLNDTLEIYYADYRLEKVVIIDYSPIKITLSQGNLPAVTIDCYRLSAMRNTTGAVTIIRMEDIEKRNITKNRTFFGRIFHSIGNLFR